MNFSEFEWTSENAWLQKVFEEIHKQFAENRNLKESFERDFIRTQRDMWNELSSVSITNGLDQIVDFMQFVNTTKTQKRDHEFMRKLEERYERMLLSPYFGRFDFYENDNEKTEKYYIGIINLVNEEYDFLVYDWRAPISSMFYECEIGSAKYEAPDGIISGKLTLKRQYKISNGKIEYMFDSNLKIDDEILQDILGKNTDDKMKAIVTTIQREQNRVIRNEEYKNLIVQGPAGSGKTSIALHRIAYLLYKHRDRINPQNIVIFSPNDIFNDYISNVLPQLGEDNMYQTTFKEYMHKSLGDEFDKENYSQMMEYILSSVKDEEYQKRINSIKLKSSIEFLGILKRYVSYLEQKERNFTDVFFKDKLIVSAKDIKELFYKDYARFPIKGRLQKIKSRILYLVEPYEKERVIEIADELFATGSYIDKEEVMEHSAVIVRNEMESMNREINRMTDFNLLDIYKRLFINSNLFLKDSNSKLCESEISEIKRYTLKSLKAQILNYEDQLALLYLKGVLGDLPKTSEIKYVIIDEAQDYTPLQYEIFHQLFSSASITLLGDIQQSINPFMNVGDYGNITNIFPKDTTCFINLTKSYRSTMEITMFSRRLLKKNITDECVERSGDKPLLINLQNNRAINERILEDIKKCKVKGYKSIGIITRTVKEANKVYNSLSDKVHIKAILEDDDEYVSDTLVIPVYLAKGLEFDVVFIYNAGDGNYGCEEERLLLYTACTRALHVLRIYYSGELTPLLKKALL
jgi:DNA helicase-2/ATP-dependent DNA helicase PcrA